MEAEPDGVFLTKKQIASRERTARKNLRKAWEFPEQFGPDSKQTENLKNYYLNLLKHLPPADEAEREQFYTVLQIAWWAWWRACDYTFERLNDKYKLYGKGIREGSFTVVLGSTRWFATHAPIFDANFERFNNSKAAAMVKGNPNLTSFVTEESVVEGAVFVELQTLPNNIFQQCWFELFENRKDFARFSESVFVPPHIQVQRVEPHNEINNCLFLSKVAFPSYALSDFGENNHFANAVSVWLKAKSFHLRGNVRLASDIVINNSANELVKILATDLMVPSVSITNSNSSTDIEITGSNIGKFLVRGDPNRTTPNEVSIKESRVGSFRLSELPISHLKIQSSNIEDHLTIANSSIDTNEAAAGVLISRSSFGQRRDIVPDPLGFDIGEASSPYSSNDPGRNAFELELPDLGYVYFEHSEFFENVALNVHEKIDQIEISGCKFSGHFVCKNTSVGSITITALQNDNEADSTELVSTVFSGHVSFSSLKDNSIGAFRAYDTRFNRQLFIRGQKVRGSFVVERCKLGEFPRLEASSLSFSTSFRDTEFSWRSNFSVAPVKHKNDWLAECENALRTLSERMEKIRNHEAASFFERERHKVRMMRTDGGSFRITRAEKAFSWLYAGVSDYGYSLIRPIVGFCSLVFACAAVYSTVILWNQADCCPGARETHSVVVSSFGLSTLNSLRPFYTASAALDQRTQTRKNCEKVETIHDAFHALNASNGGVFKVISVAQSFIALFFVFLFLLALRRRFQMS